jgi:hypothetical protein
VSECDSEHRARHAKVGYKACWLSSSFSTPVLTVLYCYVFRQEHRGLSDEYGDHLLLPSDTGTRPGTHRERDAQVQYTFVPSPITEPDNWQTD